MENKGYKQLRVWEKSFELTLAIYKTSEKFPKSELYGLTSQLRRAAVSIPSNIAEGNTRAHKSEYLQFLNVAFSSGAELETQLLLAKELDYLGESTFMALSSKLTEVMKMLNGLIGSLKPSV